MKKLSVIFLLTFCIFLLFVCECLALNPFVTTVYTADPSAHVFEGRVYVYTSHDRDNPDWFNMEDYHVFSSSGDLKEWVDHGVILHLLDVPWAKKCMWAPDCAYKNGTYYLYFPASITTKVDARNNPRGEFKIGVATSPNPYGPFIAEPEPIPGTDSVDPAVFIDDDGQAYLFWGGQGHGDLKYPKWAKLKSNMKEIDGEIKEIKNGIDYWFEACWVHKKDGIYYFSYSTGSNINETSTIHYSIARNKSDFLNGKWEHMGEVIPEVTGWTNHQSFVEYNGKWYAFFHNCDLSGPDSNNNYTTEKRSVCVTELTYNGIKMNPVKVTGDEFRIGVGTSAYSRIKAQFFNKKKSSSGIQLEDIQGGELGKNVGYIKNGDWLLYKQLDFGEPYTCGKFEINVASPYSGGTIEIRKGNENGLLLGTVSVPNTGGWQNWRTVSCDIKNNHELSGPQDITLVFKGSSEYLFNLNYFRFIRRYPYNVLPPERNVTFRSMANNKYVRADFNSSQNGPLYAYSNNLGPWEQFVIEPIPGDNYDRYVRIKSTINNKNWKYTENGPILVNDPGKNLDDRALWEWVWNGGSVSIRSKYMYKLAEYKNYDQGIYNVGGGSRPYPEVQFYVEVCDAPIGCTIALKSVSNGKYISSNNSNYDICANKDRAEEWEWFIVEDAGSGLVALKSVSTGQYLRVSSGDTPVRADGGTTFVTISNGKEILDNRERFQWRNNGDGTIALLSVHNFRYLCADSLKGTDPIKLYANRERVAGDWEKFYCQLQ
ncbi:MAG: family 43 glycosylhydrolase [Halanaerobiaceae bacterium]|nr:family 43 glycosylhydrolase [Halanaerobiaceae bacterium]